MATQKPISTISYNTEPFLREVLQRLYKAHKVQAWQYIKHEGEDGDKDHFHLRLEPNTRLDQMEVAELFKEHDPKHEKPLGIRPFRPSKEEDWFLYVLHDEQYLLAHQAEAVDRGGKIRYKEEDIQASDGYDVHIAVVRARSKQKYSNASVVKQIQEGRNPLDMVASGVPVPTVLGIQKLAEQFAMPALHSEYMKEQERNRELIEAIHEIGYEVVFDDDDTPHLVKK